QAEDGIRDKLVTGVQTCALPILKIAVGSVRALRNERRACQIPANRRTNLADSRGNPGRESAERVAAEGCQGRARSRGHTPLPIEIGRASCRERGKIRVGAV